MTQAESLANTYREHTEIRYQPKQPYDSGPLFNLVYDAAEEASVEKIVEMDNNHVRTAFTFVDGSVLNITSQDDTHLTMYARAPEINLRKV